MGKIISAVSSFDSAPEVASEQSELVETLANLAQAKADYFLFHSIAFFYT